MPTPLTQLLPQIVTLNVDSEPFAYYATGNQIIGWWDIAKVTTLYPTEVDHVDESYRLTVTLDERNGSYKYVDHSYKAETRAGFGDGGSFDGLDGPLRFEANLELEHRAPATQRAALRAGRA